eukprot:CAMPEP_0201723648 /NCGR_PEP_ID=MMETSP0593-20130828/7624_1 /ASSEMBLY_ACC=CAM_ASM_000672 /TAXON_ID=267983 /ORGANISM="Skeletonema japonicum, Strain CCMP2506" /LENGTH=198 /DNA_ID=CAMNT_0048214777 /DNA_START=26 /DNA_END=622 /DNA_ORIENTATION=-
MSTPLADELSNYNDAIEIDTDGQVTQELPLSDLNDHNDDNVITTPQQSSSLLQTIKNRKRSVVLLALVALLAIIGLSIGMSSRNTANDGSADSIQTQDLKQQPPLDQPKPKKQTQTPQSQQQLPVPKKKVAYTEAEAPKPTPVKPPKKATTNTNKFATPFPTEEGTFTVSAEVTAPPTVGNRNNIDDEEVIESPTWRG